MDETNNKTTSTQPRIGAEARIIGKNIKVKYTEHPERLFKHRWNAYYKNGRMNNPTIVYGETEKDALYAALAEYRRNLSFMSFTPLEEVVDHVEPLN